LCGCLQKAKSKPAAAGSAAGRPATAATATAARVCEARQTADDVIKQEIVVRQREGEEPGTRIERDVRRDGHVDGLDRSSIILSR
jgi:hypothetical protein